MKGQDTLARSQNDRARLAARKTSRKQRDWRTRTRKWWQESRRFGSEAYRLEPRIG